MKSSQMSLMTFLLLFLFLLMCSCKDSEVNPDLTSLPQHQTKDELEKFEGFTNSISGKVLVDEHSDWKSTKITVGNRESISALSFINERVGWSCNTTKIFKTQDSGKTWQPFKLNFIGKGKIAFFQFIDDLQGWLVLEDTNGVDYAKDDRIRIYRTMDGGKKWNLSHIEMSVSFHDALFSKGGGWVIGMKFVGDGASERSPLALHFSDQDEWKDVSEFVRNLSYDAGYREGDFPSLDRLTFEQNNCVITV